MNARRNRIIQTIKESAESHLSHPKPIIYTIEQQKSGNSEIKTKSLRTSRQDHSIQYPKIASTIKGNVEEETGKVFFEEVGTVQHLGNGVAIISGLLHVGIDELVLFSNGTKGLTIGLSERFIETILLGKEEGIYGGDLVISNNERLTIPIGWNLIGRVINSLAQPLDEDGPIEAEEYRTLDRKAPAIIDRSPVNVPLYTGIRICDALFPIGKGQRELIAGDRQTGKTSFAIDTILNQKDKQIYCIYVAIGQKKSEVVNVLNVLKANGALDYTTVVSASADDPPALRYLAPYTGCTIAEFILDNHQDVLIIYDDLSKHAQTYREISLLLRRPPGREAYPGDVFYLHSRLLERACNLNDKQGGGSITALPIIALEDGNISGYIPTNLISICDGQIVFDKDIFNKNQKPAVNIGLSISRVGSSAQIEAMKKISSELRLALTQYEEVEKFARFGTEVDESTSSQIQRGKRLMAILNQQIHQPMTIIDQVITLFAAARGFFDDVSINQIRNKSKSLLNYIYNNYKELVEELSTLQDINSEIEENLTIVIKEFILKEKIHGKNDNDSHSS